MYKHFTEKEQAEWLARQPKKVIAAKAIIRSQAGNILIVKPNYKNGWQLPGGGIELHEEPRAGLIRELKEEVGLMVDPTQLTLIDSVFRPKQDNLILVYKYDALLDEAQSLNIPEDEIEAYRFIAPKDLAGLLADYYTDFCHKLQAQ